MVAALFFQETAVDGPAPRDASFWESPFPISRPVRMERGLPLSRPDLISWWLLPWLPQPARLASEQAVGRELAWRRISASPVPEWMELSNR